MSMFAHFCFTLPSPQMFTLSCTNFSSPLSVHPGRNYRQRTENSIKKGKIPESSDYRIKAQASLYCPQLPHEALWFDYQSHISKH